MRLIDLIVRRLLNEFVRRQKSLKGVLLRQKGDEKMKTRSLILMLGLLVLLLFVSLSTVSAKPNAPIECVIDIVYDEYDDGFYWYGPVSGCILEGTIRFDEDEENPSYITGNRLHFFEKFTITTSEGEIYGINAGVGDIFKKFKFRAHGWVTDASPEWEHLIGYKTFEMGTSSDPADFPPITAPGTLMRFVPANRQSAP